MELHAPILHSAVFQVFGVQHVVTGMGLRNCPMQGRVFTHILTFLGIGTRDSDASDEQQVHIPASLSELGSKHLCLATLAPLRSH